MKWPPFVSRINPCKVWRGLVALAAVKTVLTIAAALSLLIPTPDPVPQAFGPRQATAQETAETPAEPEAETRTGDPTPVSALLQELRQREMALDRREQDLKALESRVDRRMAELRQMEASIKKMLEEADSVKNERIRHLVGVYSNMKPKEAAKVIETLDQDIAVKILSGMQGRIAGEILSFVETRKAAALTEQLTNLQVPFAK
ncbi:MAG: DUF3552 domain-containing protein [Deltaproteobacteria bacterium]|nr:DUF3552 domain-containing protein [Deltaproteobacteria bacterium]